MKIPAYRSIRRTSAILALTAGLVFPAIAQTATYQGPNTTTNGNTWMTAGNWNPAGVPSGSISVVIPAGKTAAAWDDAVPVYTGDLSLGANATLQIGWTTGRPASFNSLGLPGTTLITLAEGSLIRSRTGSSFVMPEVLLTGNATARMGESTQVPSQGVFDYPVNGDFTFTIQTNADGGGIELNHTNTFRTLVVEGLSGRGQQMAPLEANAPGSLGLGNVTTVPDSQFNRSPQIQFNAPNAMAITGKLILNGGGPSGNGNNRVLMNESATIGGLVIDGLPQAPGTYTSSQPWLDGPGTLTVLLISPLNPDPAFGKVVPLGNVELTWTNEAPTSGSDVWVDVWFGTDPGNLTQVASQQQNISSFSVNAPAVGTYYWRVDSYLDGAPGGTPKTGGIYHFVVNDSDGDGMPDDWELLYTDPPSATALDPALDADSDGLNNLDEYLAGTIPTNPDTDGDGLLDGAETNTGIWVSATDTGTDPLDTDSDGDGLLDGVETNTGTWVGTSDTGTDPNNWDSDGDALADGVETNTGTFVDGNDTGTNPLLADTDNDGAGDWYEITASYTSPVLAGETSNIPYPLPAPDASTGATDKPVKVFIMSGQSNMVGFGQVFGTDPGTLATITADNKFPNIVDPEGGFLSRNDVKYRGVVSALGNAPLAPRFGADGGKIGPEFGFGHVMGWYFNEPVLLIKASIGNRALGWDVLPPGSTQYEYNGKTYAGFGDSPASWTTGTTPTPINWYAGKEFDRFFRDELDWAPAGAGDSMFNGTDVLDNFASEYPEWAAQGFEIAGYVWWQGHNDTGMPYSSRYEQNLVQLIKQLRQYYEGRYNNDLNGEGEPNNLTKTLPNAPFVAATYAVDGFGMGTGGQAVAQAQLNVDGDTGNYPEFAGNVKTIEARGYWRESSESPNGENFHYNWNAETYMLVGDALGRAMVSLQDDVSPPFPNPATFAIAPEAVVPGTIGMVATTATDPSGPVEYLFENITNGNTSGWIATASWNNTGLTNGVSYTYRVKTRDALGNEGDWSAELGATAGSDTTAPNPNPMAFAAAPAATGENTITMTATAATDINGVEYYFDAIDGGNDSGWQSSPEYTDSGLAPGTTYTYVVRARDSIGNETTASAPAAATTDAPDLTAPTPDPMSFAVAPAATGQTSIAMTATTASDPGGVEYRFNNVTLGTDSGWQDSPAYEQTGLTPDTAYTYTVQARDKSPAQNTTATSAPGAATTDAPDLTAPAIVSLNPVNGASGVAVNTVLTIGFDEEVKKGTGNIVIREAGGAAFETIDVNSGAVVVTGASVTIDPSLTLVGGESYYIEIASGAILDLADNAFGISGDATWSFTTAVPGALRTYTGPNGAWNSDTWNNNANWDDGAGSVPTGDIDVEIASGKVAWAVTASTTPVYTGNLTLRTNSTLGAGPNTGTANAYGASVNTSSITLETGSKIIMRNGGAYTFNQAFVLAGPATLTLSESSNGQNSSRTFATGISGAHPLVMNGQNGNSANLNAANGFTSLTASVVGSNNWKVVANAAGSLGTGDVTINNAVNLIVNAADAMNANAALNLNGARSTKVAAETTKLILNANLTVAELWIGGVQQTAGDYTAASGLLAENGDPLISGSGTLTVTGGTAVAPFDDWADLYPALTNRNPALDFDGGSLPTGIEWVVGGDPSDGSDDAGLLPTIDTTTDPDGKLLFTFRRTVAAGGDDNTTIAVEYGSDLAGWSTAVHEGTGPDDITVSEQANGFGTGIDKVTVALPPSLAAAGKLFVRLNVAVATE